MFLFAKLIRVLTRVLLFAKMTYMKKSTRGRRLPKTLTIRTFRAEGKTIMEIAHILGCTKQWVDFVLKRDGDTLPPELAVKKLLTPPPIDTEIEESIIKV